MPPKRKAPAAAAAGKGNSKKVYGKAPELPEGETLTDFSKKQQWRLGKSIGSGGFGRIYLASKAGEKSAQFVVKMEPAGNGPLFQEIHVYQRIAKPEMLQQWCKQKGLKFLGIPAYVAAGLHSKNNIEFRFLVMPRFAADLESHRESCEGGRLAAPFVFRLAAGCLDSLEYLHYAAQYVHADLKGENLLAASAKSMTTGEQFYLVDYGLARKVADQPVYKEDPKKAHDGTLIFTSLDAHRGCVPSYRGDLEILGYNLMFWLTGTLPWMAVDNDPNKVFEAKQVFSKNLRVELGRSPTLTPYSAELTKFFEYVYSLDYAERPDFDQLRQLVQKALTKTKKSAAGTSTSSPSTPSNATPRSPLRAARLKSPPAKIDSSAVSAKKTVPLLQNFVDDRANDSSSSDDEDVGISNRRRLVSSNRLARPAIKKKVILADDTPSPSPASVRVQSPRSIIPGKANLRRYDPAAAAKRRSSIMVKKKYLTSKKTDPTKATFAVTTRAAINGKKGKSYRISSSSSSDDE